MKTEKLNENLQAVHLPDASVCLISMNHKRDDSWTSQFFSHSNSWESDPAIVMGKKIVPYGNNNDLPTVIRRIMDDSNIGPGILERKLGLQYGDGPFLYEEVISDDDKIVRKAVVRPQITKWLESWNYHRYIEIATTEFMHTKGFYTRWYRNRASRLSSEERSLLSSQGMDSSEKITKLEPVLNTQARLEWPEIGEKRLENVKAIYVGDYENNCLYTGLTKYPMMDQYNPFKHPVSMSYHNLYSFARSFYSVPSYLGTLKWLTSASEIPDIIKYLTENGIAAAFHIHSPKGYWDDKRQKLDERFPEETDAQIDKRLQDLKEELFRSISSALAGKQNAGKFIETVDFYDDQDNLCQWKIEPIDQKIKDFIEAQIKVSEKADSAATSGMGLNPSLANIITNGSFASGSQLLYAMKFHILTDVNIPERIIFEAINQAIKINWPDENVKMGFARKIVMKEDEVSPANRVSAQA